MKLGIQICLFILADAFGWVVDMIGDAFRAAGSLLNNCIPGLSLISKLSYPSNAHPCTTWLQWDMLLVQSAMKIMTIIFSMCRHHHDVLRHPPVLRPQV